MYTSVQCTLLVMHIKTFSLYVATVIFGETELKLKRTEFISNLYDGSTDACTVEWEVIFVRFV